MALGSFIPLTAPLQADAYPIYFKTKSGLLAFVAKDKVYKISPVGSNTNAGVTLDYYTTRRMVNQLWPLFNREQLTQEKFKQLFGKLYYSYLDKIINHA